MEGSVKVLGLFGSPRRGGNTERLLEAALAGAAAAGAQTERFHLCDLAIHPCRACQACFRDGDCVIDDDMQVLYPRLLAADAVLLASPIYFYGITAQAKAAVDRCQALWARKYILRKTPAPVAGPRRQGFFIAVCASRGRRAFEGAILTVRYGFDAFDAAYGGELLFPGVDGRGDILQVPGALAQAEAAGRRLAAPPPGPEADPASPGER